MKLIIISKPIETVKIIFEKFHSSYLNANPSSTAGLNEEPIIEYRPPSLKGLELDAFFRKHQIALEVQGAQHRFHNTSWYKDVKKLEDIVPKTGNF